LIELEAEIGVQTDEAQKDGRTPLYAAAHNDLLTVD